MRLHVIQHVPAEGPGRIAEWAEARGFELTASFAITEEFPSPAEVDLVCVMGGPMDADDHAASPWLAAEKAWLREVVDARVPVLGTCLGSQIMAEVLGGRIARNPVPEIGYFPIELSESGRTSTLFGTWPAHAVVGQWHCDTFELPEGLAAAASSEAAANQAFDFEGRVAGVQFHLEWDEECIDALLDEFSEDLERDGRWVRDAGEFRAGLAEYGDECATMLWSLLDALVAAR